MTLPTEAFAAGADAPPQGRIENRTSADRRKKPTNPWWAFPLAGRRMRSRRADEHRQPYFADRFSTGTFILVITLLTASITDAILTIQLLRAGADEMNPLMDHFLGHGVQSFLLVKYLLTASGIPLLLIFQNHYLFGTRVRVAYFLPCAVVLYLALIAYQLVLMHRYVGL